METNGDIRVGKDDRSLGMMLVGGILIRRNRDGNSNLVCMVCDCL